MIEKKINGEVLYDGYVVRLEKDKVLCPNNNEAYREIVRHSGGAAVLCVTKENKIVLVRQFRYAFNEILLEIPAGKLEKGEMPQASALRELEEEAGYKALASEHLITIYPTVGYCSEKIYVYLVTDYEITETNLDENEFVEVVEVTIEEAVNMIQTGEIKDGKTICAIYQYLMRNK